MSREWKPGDVAVSEVGGRPHVIFRSEMADTREERWVDRFGPLLPDHEWPSRPAIRPLVVIDPEDREQVERLTRLYVSEFGGQANGFVVDAMQAALREFANPTEPRPDEPMGLGAVVEDVHGDLWVRCDLSEDEPWTRHTDDSMTVFSYREIDAVHVHARGFVKDGAS